MVKEEDEEEEEEEEEEVVVVKKKSKATKTAEAAEDDEVRLFTCLSYLSLDVYGTCLWHLSLISTLLFAPWSSSSSSYLIYTSFHVKNWANSMTSLVLSALH